MKKALIFQGGWDGHEPHLTSVRFARLLNEGGVQTEIYDTLDCLADAEKLLEYDLFVACWTSDSIKHEYVQNISRAVGRGAGLAGCHGGMCDSFRDSPDWQFITGGQWVAHPGNDGTRYVVNINHGSSPIIEGLEDFEVCSEQYYMHIDPAVEVLATTRFPLVNGFYAANKPVDMPVIWTKYWGAGRIFYNSLGHHDDVFDKSPTAEVLMRRGLLWAADSKQYAIKNGLSDEKYLENKLLYKI